MLQADKLVKAFDGLGVLRGISLGVNKGEAVAVIGRSGSGKSTLLRCLNNLEKIDGGSIAIDGQYLVKDGVYAPEKALRGICLKMGYVFQNFNLFPHMSVLRNLTEAQRCVLGKGREAAEAYARQLLKKVGLSDKAGAYPYQLSGGQQQRVAIARAMVKNPKLLLCDELTGALDTRSSRSVLKFIEKINNQYGTTTLIITHNEAIADLADTVVRIRDGKIASVTENAEKRTADEIEL